MDCSLKLTDPMIFKTENEVSDKREGLKKRGGDLSRKTLFYRHRR